MEKDARQHQSNGGDSKKPRQPPVHIPLDFETAVEGLLRVDPKKPEKGDGAKKKPDRK